MRRAWTFPICLLLACCADPAEKSVPHTGDVPDADRLVVRIGKLWEAAERQDWRAWCDLTAQAKSGLTPYEELLAEIRKQGGDRPYRTTWKIAEIREDELDSDEGVPGTTAKARVTMDVTVAKPDGDTRPVKDLTDYWYYIDGEWYWGWRGFPSD